MRVTIENVSYSYRRKPALKEVSWALDGGVTGLLGPNGAGKTTLLSLLVTLLKPKTGRISLGDHDLGTTSGRAEVRRLLGFVPQRFSLASEMTVEDTVAYAAWVHGVSDRDCTKAASRAIDEVGLTDERAHPVRALSGGERQRLGLAAALAHDPAVLILDEPTVGLDPGQRLKMRQRIADIGKERTVLISSHLLEDIEHLCGRVGVLAQGRMVFDGDINELDKLIANTPTGTAVLGSRFERAYDSLITRLGDA
jgi:ABC-2 type transport system ATP-binding protein